MGDKLVTELSRLLREKGWNQAELARQVGVSHTTISKVLNGERHPSIKLCQRFASAFGISVDEVYQWAGIMPEKGDYPPQVDDWGRRLQKLDDEARMATIRAIDQVLKVAEESAPYRVRRGKGDRESR